MSEVGDIVLCIRATIGDRNWSDNQYCLGRGVAGLRADEKRLNQQYLWHWVGFSAHQLKSKGRGATFLQVCKADIASLEIPLPPLAEQKRIAAILDAADALRAKRRESLAQLDTLLQSTFLNMFGDPVTNPKGWEVKKLDDLVTKLGDGLHGTPIYSESGNYYFVNGNNLRDGKIHIDNSTKRVDETEYLKHKRELNDTTMLVSINGTIGKVAFYDGENIVLGKSACYFNLKTEQINSQYLYHQINSQYFMDYAIGQATGSTIKNVSLKTMRSFPVLYAPLDLQRCFATIVESIERQKTLLRAHLTELDTLFDSLQSRAFNGEL
ncbi:restriction endonuclease subunit S [Halothiobacillus sp.]|uniref:restriction endonuclease subunit S n=1 Tax=Halothiobacillus sp. TaxID=1891311 RepID=UPI0026348C8E|nr:restriction endonuclease subunit S [Halothiobacillus sp.]MDD4965764.1 restriction endonuclease subunit S [Halothiobacillus sp.]